MYVRSYVVPGLDLADGTWSRFYFPGMPLDPSFIKGKYTDLDRHHSYCLACFDNQLEESGSVEPRPECVPRHEIYRKT